MSITTEPRRSFIPKRPSPSRLDDSVGVVKRNLPKAGFVLGTLLLCLITLEVGLRVTGRYHMDNTVGYFEKGGISYVLKKNVTKEVRWPTMSFTVHTSDLGFRAPHTGSQSIGERPYDVALGASDVFGNGLNYEDTFIGVFAGKLKSHNIDVVNMAVAGHHLLEQAALFKQFAASAPRPPSEVLIILNPLVIGGYDDINTNVIVLRGDLFEKDNWMIPLLRNTLGNTLAVYCFFRDGIRGAQSAFLGREDYSLDFYIKRFSSKHPIHQPAKTADFLRHMRDLEQYIRSLNAKPVCVYSPPAAFFLLRELTAKGKLAPGLVDTEFFGDLARRHCEAEGIEFVNIEPLLQERYDQGEKLNFDADGHFNGPTSRVVGEYLYESLRSDRTRKLN